MSLSSFTEPVRAAYSYALQPVAPFRNFGLPISTLDFISTVRLCVIMRQIRRDERVKHATKSTKFEPKSMVRDIGATLLVVYGGEALANTYLGIPPSFLTSSIFPLLYTFTQGFIELLPDAMIPNFSLSTELPLSVVDAWTRAFLLCSLIPPGVINNTRTEIATSGWALLITSLITANAGFFFTTSLSLLAPTPLTLSTPPELLPYGWTTIDLWAAPVVTGIYATLTHMQPIWAKTHALAVYLLHSQGWLGEKPNFEKMGDEDARAVCFWILAGLFVFRAVKNFGGAALQPANKKTSKAQAKTKKATEAKKSDAKEVDSFAVNASAVGNEKAPLVQVVPTRRKASAVKQNKY